MNWINCFEIVCYFIDFSYDYDVGFELYRCWFVIFYQKLKYKIYKAIIWYLHEKDNREVECYYENINSNIFVCKIKNSLVWAIYISGKNCSKNGENNGK